MNVPQTSASDRYEAARKALSQYDQVSHPDTLEGEEAAHALASALRALITPPNVAESEKEAVRRVYMGIHSFPWHISGNAMRDLIALGYRAGIQAAHETWEPADHPSQEMMLRWLGIGYGKSIRSDSELFIDPQYIEKEED